MDEGKNTWSEEEKLAFRRINRSYLLWGVPFTLIIILFSIIAGKDVFGSLICFVLYFVISYLIFRLAFRYSETYRRRKVAWYVTEFKFRGIDILGIVIACLVVLAILVFINHH